MPSRSNDPKNFRCGDALVRLAVGLAGLSAATSLFAQELPIGIPSPTFGFADSHQMYANDTNYSMGQSGPYTHYVDNTHPSCGDFLNDGTEGSPRCSIPTSLDPGDVVEIHGGPYVAEFDWNFSLQGTPQAPVFVRGVDNGSGYPVLESENARDSSVVLSGTYGIFENLVLNEMGLKIGNGSESNHLGARNLDIGWFGKTCVTISADYSVISNSEVHHCQDAEKDRHGVYVTQGTDYTWILYNHIHHNSGNGIQYTHRAELDPPDFTFIGGNHIHSDREVAVATKWAGRTVVSSNVMHSYRPSSEGVPFCFDDGSACMTPISATNGPAIIIGADGYPQEKWVIYNLIYNSNHCIRHESAVKANIIGNICANIDGVGIRFEKNGDMYIVNNTFYNTGTDGRSGAFQQDWRDQFDLSIQNNLILSPAGRALWFEQNPLIARIEFNNNLIWNAGADFNVLWKNDVVSVGSLTELRNLMWSDVAQMTGNLVADPGMTVRDTPSPIVEDFMPPANSPLIGAGSDVLLMLDNEFKSTFGADVTIIPTQWQNRPFDIGAVPLGYGEPVIVPNPPVLD